VVPVEQVKVISLSVITVCTLSMTPEPKFIIYSIPVITLLQVHVGELLESKVGVIVEPLAAFDV